MPDPAVGPCARAEPLLSAWLDAALDGGEAAFVRQHLRACAGCSGLIEELGRVRGSLRSMPVRRPTSQVHGAALRVARRGRAVHRARLVTGAVIASLAAVGVGAVLVGGEPGARSAPVVRVPVDAFVADHMAKTAGSSVGQPLLVDFRTPLGAGGR